eukprot:scpid47053/ scgid12877/ 
MSASHPNKNDHVPMQYMMEKNIPDLRSHHIHVSDIITTRHNRNRCYHAPLMYAAALLVLTVAAAKRGTCCVATTTAAIFQHPGAFRPDCMTTSAVQATARVLC